MNKNIKCCPFCGGHAFTKARRLNQPNMRGVIQIFVECKMCHARGPFFTDFHNDDSVSTMTDKAINAWNDRKGE